MTKELTMGKTKLPGGWVSNKLGDLGKVSMCKRILKKQTSPIGEIPFYKIGTFGKTPNAFISKEIYEEYISKYSFPKEGDILLSASGTIGRRVIYDGKPAYFQDSNIVWIDNDEKKVINKYLYKFYGFCNWNPSKGATISRLYNADLRKIIIPVPPLAQQKKIVALLDKVFTAISRAKDNAEQNLLNAKELFESYLQNIFENIGENWITSSIGESCNLMTGGTPSRSKKEYFDNGTINWLVSGDINKKIINDCDGKITELGFENSNTKILPLNSVMIALNGQGKTRGSVAMLRIEATCNQSLISIYPKDDNRLLPELIYSNLEGRYNEIRKITGDGGNDRRGLNMPLIRKISFSYPKSLNEQREIIQQLGDLKLQTKKLEAIYRQKTIDLDELKKSILQKAFNGELI